MTYEEEYFKYTNEQKLKAQQMDMETKNGTVISLQLPKLNKDTKQYFIIDFAKVKTIEELVLIVASMGVLISTDNPLFPQLEHLVDKEHPIKESDLK